MASPEEFLRQMGRLSETLARLDALPRRVAEYAAPEITKALQKEFASGSDPYGRKWRKLATGKPSHLTESGRLRKGTRAAPLPGRRAGVRILLGAKYAVYHQTGTQRMPARKILPERGMPATWSAAINRALQRVWREAQR